MISYDVIIIQSYLVKEALCIEGIRISKTYFAFAIPLFSGYMVTSNLKHDISFDVGFHFKMLTGPDSFAFILDFYFLAYVFFDMHNTV